MDPAVVEEIKATSPEPHAEPAAEEAIIQAPTVSKEIVTDDTDTGENEFSTFLFTTASDRSIDERDPNTEIPVPPGEADGLDGSRAEGPVPEKTLAPEILTTPEAAVINEDADLQTDDNPDSKAVDREVIGIVVEEPTPRTLETLDTPLVSLTQDIPAQHVEESADETAQSVPLADSVPAVSTFDVSTDDTLAEAEDISKGEATVVGDNTGGASHADGASPTADPTVATVQNEEAEVAGQPAIDELPSIAESDGDAVKVVIPEKALEAQDGTTATATSAEDGLIENGEVRPESGGQEDAKPANSSAIPAQSGEVEGNATAEVQEEPLSERTTLLDTIERSLADVVEDAEANVEEANKLKEGSENVSEDKAVEEQPTPPNAEEIRASEESTTPSGERHRHLAR